MDAGFASETYRTRVTEDENAFVDKDRFSLVVARREVLATLPADGVKLVVYYRAHPIADTDRLAATLRDHHASAAVAAGASGYELLTPLPEAHGTDRYPAAADAVAISWWDSVDAAVAFERGSGQWALSGVALGAARLIARQVVVV